MSATDPLYVVKCPYCEATIARFEDTPTVECKVCGGTMRIVKPPSYIRAK